MYPRVVEDIVRGMPDFGSEYRLVFRREKGLDSLVVQVEPLPGTEARQAVEELRRRIRAVCGINSSIEALPHGTLPKSEVKAKRIIDERQAAELQRM